MHLKNTPHFQDYLEIKTLIEQENHFLITTHIHPDGDSLASVLVFIKILKHLEKQYIAVLDDDIPEKFHFMPGVEEIQRCPQQDLPFFPKVFIFLDSSNLERIGCVKNYIHNQATIINIDHHTSNQYFADLNIVDEKESSSVELLYPLLSLYDIPISKDIACLIYTGIVSDTGRFLFTNTTDRSFLLSAEMIQKGASPDMIAEHLFYQKNIETMQALGASLSTIQFEDQNRIASMIVKHSDHKNSNHIDTEGFIDYLLMINGVELGFLIHEVKSDCCRVSFRTKGQIDANELARNFDGGGHLRASGCNISGSATEVRSKVLTVIREQFS